MPDTLAEARGDGCGERAPRAGPRGSAAEAAGLAQVRRQRPAPAAVARVQQRHVGRPREGVAARSAAGGRSAETATGAEHTGATAHREVAQPRAADQAAGFVQ